MMVDVIPGELREQVCTQRHALSALHAGAMAITIDRLSFSSYMLVPWLSQLTICHSLLMCVMPHMVGWCSSLLVPVSTDSSATDHQNRITDKCLPSFTRSTRGFQFKHCSVCQQILPCLASATTCWGFIWTTTSPFGSSLSRQMPSACCSC